MRRTTIILATSALLFVPLGAAAKSQSFETTIATSLQAPVKIEVVLSEDLAFRANNLPKKLSDRGSGSRSMRAGFSGNGFYGDRDLERLVDEVLEELTDDFAKRGIAISDHAAITFRVTLEDVKNNRPTFEQMSKEPGLSFDSFGVGGAELSGELVSDDGNSLGTVNYRWFETGLRNDGFARANGTWSDANRAISRFAKKTAKALS